MNYHTTSGSQSMFPVSSDKKFELGKIILGVLFAITILLFFIDINISTQNIIVIVCQIILLAFFVDYKYYHKELIENTPVKIKHLYESMGLVLVFALAFTYELQSTPILFEQNVYLLLTNMTCLLMFFNVFAMVIYAKALRKYGYETACMFAILGMSFVHLFL